MVSIVGTASADVVSPSGATGGVSGGLPGAGADTLDGLDGNDQLDGGGGDDLIWLGAGDDTGRGGEGGDTLWGEAGQDRLDGGAGADTLFGGGGIDIADYRDAPGPVEVLATDVSRIAIYQFVPILPFYQPDGLGARATVQAGGSTDLVHDVEIFAGSAFGDRMALDASAPVRESIRLLRMEGMAGADTIAGHGRTEIAAGYGFSPHALRLDLSGGDSIAMEDGWGGIDTLLGIRSLSGTAGFGDTIIGGAAANWLAGDGGGDLISGGNGADTLEGGAGADTLTGEGGEDLFLYSSISDLDGDLITDLGNGDRVFIEGPSYFDHVEDQAFSGGGTGEIRNIQGPGSTRLLQVDSNGDGIADASLTLSGASIRLVEAFAHFGRMFLTLRPVSGSGHADTLLGGAGAEALSGLNGDDLLDGGAGPDELDGGAGSDTLIGGRGSDTLIGGEGFDIADYSAVSPGLRIYVDSGLFFAQEEFFPEYLIEVEGVIGGQGDDTIWGDRNSNLLVGGAGNDSIFGLGSPASGQLADGGDTILGGEGNDTLWSGAYLIGGPGNDFLNMGVADFRHVAVGIRTIGYDRIEDGEGGTDSFGVLSGIIGGSGADTLAHIDMWTFARGGDGNDSISGFQNLYGEGGNDSISGQDAIFGGSGDDLLEGIGLQGAKGLDGGEGNDILRAVSWAARGSDGFGRHTLLLGGPGDDIFFGGGGNDTLIGGEGFDIMDMSRAGAPLAVNLAAGQVADGRAEPFYPASIDSFSGMEGVIGGSFADTLVGTAAEERFDGGAGADRMAGGAGNDTYVADSQADLVFEAAGEGTDSVIATTGFYLHPHVEQLTLSGSAGYGVGNDEDNRITGNELANTLIGHGGADTLLGQGGNDVVHGGEGDDRIELGAGIDYAAGGNGADTILGGDGADQIHGEGGHDSLHGGADFATDILVGGAGNDSIDGGAAWDLMYGGEGNDTFYVSQQADWVFEQPGQGTDSVIADSPNGYYLYANIENLALAGTTPFGVGNELANRITGNGVANTLLSGGGADTINGGGGLDVLWGQAGADVFQLRPGTGSDVIADFTRGEDRIDIAHLGLSSLGQVTARMTQGGAHIRLDLGGGNFAVIHHQTVAAFTLADFILAG